ncbi:MAG TPA: hypothetical protein VIN08_25530 [Ohtaekwangia sp.]|uniref:hypothetical protein n=1 Tax=Ohtaekwangia sp. TaxID=2066019 RepID=UPI002F956523
MRKLFSILLILLLAMLVYINLKLYYKPEIRVVENDSVPYDQLRQLHYLKDALEAGKAEEMQQLYPEGFVFMQALCGLAWSDFARSVTPTSALYREAHNEVGKCYKAIDSPEARSIFNENLSLPYGAFYTCWNNYLLGRKLILEIPQRRNQKDIEHFQEQCNAIAQVVRNGLTYPESYYGAAWPADIFPGIASLRIHDQLFNPSYSTTIAQWIGNVKALLDPHGLIPHAVYPVTGKPREDARGSSQSLMLIFLKEIDPAFAKSQFDLYKKYFLIYRLGLPALREYPMGATGLGDIDSGPVVFQAGAAASLVGMRTMACYNERATACALRNSIEAFGFPLSRHGKKCYLLGALPIADAFIAWSGIAVKPSITRDASWRNQFHMYSCVITSILLSLLTYTFRLWPFRKAKPE